ncbi:hypothetical protein MMYC01_204667 [Madurella mycetomatis]|uniref:Uncharacterized protein n=1 Tax=Madurella mycetomatis TaxID=100816 RepID=A0A175W9T1_9PEZI|nr:hypothetical protein MMYC01_204667 [Madurella mycetomatis]
MSSNKGSTAGGGPTDEPAAPSNEAQSTTFDASPATEAAIPAPKQQDAVAIPPVLQWLIPGFMWPLLLQSIAEYALPDWDTLGPDAFATRFVWLSRGLTLLGQPSNNIRVIDVEKKGTTIDMGEAAFDQVESILKRPMPQGSGVCRVIIGVPELGRMIRDGISEAVISGSKSEWVGFLHAMTIDEDGIPTTIMFFTVRHGKDYDNWYNDTQAIKVAYAGSIAGRVVECEVIREVPAQWTHVIERANLGLPRLIKSTSVPVPSAGHRAHVLHYPGGSFAITTLAMSSLNGI